MTVKYLLDENIDPEYRVQLLYHQKVIEDLIEIAGASFENEYQDRI